MPSPPSSAAPNPHPAGPHWLPPAVFLIALTVHCALSAVGWNNNNLPGVEFRQAQTAISAHFIQVENNFSPAYPTPVLGKPWSIPMEFPLYQWSVVVLSNATGLPLIQAARTISLLCLYLSLPAVWLLLRRLQWSRAARWLSLAIVLSCPLHIFYGRAFLIETMALMFSLWFTAAFVETMLRRSWSWCVLASLAGAAAGAVKVTTLIVYLLPCAAFAALLLFRTLWPWKRRDFSRAREVLAWGLGTVLVPFLATWLWTRFADSVKAEQVQGASLMSNAMTQFNFGYGAFQVRFQWATWEEILRILRTAVVNPWLLGIALSAGLMVAGRHRWVIGATLAAFTAAPLIFPLLYAWHDYYFVANAILLMLLIAAGVAGLAERRHGVVAAAAATLLAFGLQLKTYWDNYYADQSFKGASGPVLAVTLHDLTEPDEVIVIAGDDWNSMIPFYAQRRALMIRRELEQDWPLIGTAFSRLKDERVAALLLMGDQRDNRTLLQMAASELGIHPDHPVEVADAAVYLHRDVLEELQPGLITGESAAGPSMRERFGDRIVNIEEMPRRVRSVFSSIHPTPSQFYMQFGPATIPHGSHRVLNAHSLTQLWFTVPEGTRELRLVCGFFDGAWQQGDNSTNGIGLVVKNLTGNAPETLYERLIDPVANPADRGPLRITIPLDLPPGAKVLVEANPGPHGNQNCDWFYFERIEFTR